MPKGGRREGAGRKPVENPKSEKIMIRVDAATREKLESLAAERGVTLSALIARCIEEHLLL